MDKERYFVWKNYDALETLVESPPTTATIVEKSITTNGTYRASSDSADGYNPVVVNVANSYSAGDEGKVVDNGALVSQTAYPTTVTTNDTYDTTLNNSITVNVANSYSAADEGKVVDNGELVAQTAYPTTVTANGTITTTTNNSVTINVANSYTAGDEGKVVDNGELVSQTAYPTTVTTNGVVNTTTNNSVTVNVPSKILRLPIGGGRARPCTNVGTSYVKYWENYAPGISNFTGENIWTDGTNIYYSAGTNHYVLNKSTGDWTAKTWTGLTNFDAEYIWSDGTNIYYSASTNHYVLNTATSTWTTKTWTGLTNFTPYYIWSDGTNIYYSGIAGQYVLDKATSTWDTKTWTGLNGFEGYNVWSDGANIYYSNGSIGLGVSDNQYVLNTTTSTWDSIEWDKADLGPSQINGNNIWTDGTNIYYDDSHRLYMLIGRSNAMDFPGYWSNEFVMLDDQGVEVYLTDASCIWTDGDNVYYDDSDNHYKLINNYNPNINAPR